MTTLEKTRAEIVDAAKRTMNDTRAEGLYMALKILDKYAEQEPILDKIKKEIADNHDYYFFAENNKDIALGLEFALDIIDEHQKEVSKCHIV